MPLLNKIDFTHFYLEIKEVSPRLLFNYMNPNTQVYFKFGSLYIAISNVISPVFNLDIVISNKKDNRDELHQLMNEFKKNGFTLVTFQTKQENKAMMAIIDYLKLNLIKKTYDSYGEILNYELNLETNKTLRLWNESKSTASL